MIPSCQKLVQTSRVVSLSSLVQPDGEGTQTVFHSRLLSAGTTTTQNVKVSSGLPPSPPPRVTMALGVHLGTVSSARLAGYHDNSATSRPMNLRRNEFVMRRNEGILGWDQRWSFVPGNKSPSPT